MNQTAATRLIREARMVLSVFISWMLLSPMNPSEASIRIPMPAPK